MTATWDIARNLAWLWEWLLLLSLTCAAIYALANILVGLLAWIDQRNAEHDAQTAADWREPTRAQVEAPWLFPADEFKDTPICGRLRHEEDVRFAASVLADIDDLPGGAA